MRVYISSHDADAAESLALALTEAGHEVASIWHREGILGPADWSQRAGENFNRIRQADALILIGGTDRYPGGKYVEAGYANGQGIQVYNLGEVGNGMMHFAVRVNDVADLLAALN